MNKFSGKNALITGGSSGIGLAIARRLTTLGANVWLLARREELLMEAQKELQGLSTKEAQEIEIIPCDVTDQSSLSKSLGQVCDKVPFHFCFNSAGVAEPGDFLSLSIDKFHWMMDVNYFGTVNVLKLLVPGMKSRRTGHIVNISSMAGFLGIYGYTAYCASKFAVTGFTDTLRAELKPYSIKVSIVFPPDTQTPQLEYEEKFKPFITKEVAGSAKLMSAEAVAAEIVRRVARGKYIILPGFEAKAFYLLQNLMGRRVYPVIDMLVKDAISKLRIGRNF